MLRDKIRLIYASPMWWLRVGAVTVIAVLCFSTITQALLDEHPALPILLCSAFIAYAIAFIINTSPFPRRLPWQPWLLLLQLALSLPFEANLTVVTAATIPLVLRRRQWKTWLLAVMGSVALAQIARVIAGVHRNWNHLPSNPQWAGVAVGVAAGVLEIEVWHFFAFLAAFMIVHFDQDRRRLAQLNAELKGSQILLTESGRLAERLRISRELHDSLGHHLTSLGLQLEVASHLPDDKVRPHIAQAQFISRLLLAEIREAVSEWRSETSTALPDALGALTSAIRGTEVILTVASDIPATAPTVNHALFRCAQEAITNAIKHGNASRIEISLSQSETELLLIVRDNGHGCHHVVPGHGLNGIQSRIDEIGGTASFTTSPANGFVVEAHVPVQEFIP